MITLIRDHSLSDSSDLCRLSFPRNFVHAIARISALVVVIRGQSLPGWGPYAANNPDKLIPIHVPHRVIGREATLLILSRLWIRFGTRAVIKVV